MKAIEKLRADFANGAYADKLAEMYACSPKETGYYAERFATLIDGFETTFQEAKEVMLFSSPGRIEVGGNHTDHQHGCVLTAAINKDVIAAVRKNSEGKINWETENYHIDPVDVNELEINEKEYGKSEAIIRGIVSKMVQMGYKVGGFDCYCLTDVLQGSGLASSAAYEVLVAAILNQLYCNGDIDKVELAKIGQYAENEYYGKPCGLMDQIAAAVGGFVAIDFRDVHAPQVDAMEFDFDATKHAICLIDSGGVHIDLSEEYALITSEMKAVAKLFKKDFLVEVDEKAFLKQLGGLRHNGASDRAILRAFHFFRENKRTMDEVSALADGDFDAFLTLVRESGLSSYMYLQNVFVVSTPDRQDVSLALALCDELLGSEGAYRIHGGGFAGTVLAFVPLVQLESFREGVEAVFGEGHCEVLSVRNVGVVKV